MTQRNSELPFMSIDKIRNKKDGYCFRAVNLRNDVILYVSIIGEEDHEELTSFLLDRGFEIYATSYKAWVSYFFYYWGDLDSTSRSYLKNCALRIEDTLNLDRIEELIESLNNLTFKK